MSTIERVECWTIQVPLTTPVDLGSVRYTKRDYSIIRITDRDGGQGFAYCLARSAPLAATLNAIAPIAVDTESWATQARWDTIYAATIPIGQRGLALRALSLIDVASWDLIARTVGVPVHALLGTARTEIQLSVGGGYYRESREIQEISEEMASYVERGFELVKIPAGGADAAYEERWVGQVREMIGPTIDLAVDAHWSWRDPHEAALTLQRFDQFELAWVEDPLWPEAVPELAELREAISSPLAVGDELSGRWVYRDLALAHAADIFRVDIMTVGGFTEFVRVASLAETFGIPISTHVYPELHAHCAASREIVRWTEYVDPSAEIDMTYRFIDTPLEPQDGMAQAPQRPGLGFDLDWEWIEGSAIEYHTTDSQGQS